MTNSNLTPGTPVTDERARKNRKRKAILASGAVLGVGAVITLAAWNDTVFGNGAFGITDSAWNVQGSVNGTTWQEYETSPGGAIAFTVDPAVDAANLMPGETAKGSFWLKEAEGKMAADISIQAATGATNTLGQALRVTIKDGATTILNNAPLNASGTATTFRIPAGGTKQLDFEVTLPANANPNVITDKTVNAVWEMKAESVDNP